MEASVSDQEDPFWDQYLTQPPDYRFHATLTKAIGMRGDGVGFELKPGEPMKVTKSYCLDITLPKEVNWSWRLWRVLCLPWDIAVFIKTGRLRFL